jgi:hypothetical protein
LGDKLRAKILKNTQRAVRRGIAQRCATWPTQAQMITCRWLRAQRLFNLRTGEMSGDSRWQITIEGTPSMRLVFEPHESYANPVTTPGPNNPSASAVATAMAAINRIPTLLAAKPGLLTAIDLPQPRYRG